MKTIEVNGRTVDEALETALKELKVDKDKVTVEIVDEGSRGFLNLIGAKPARIKVTVKRNAAEDVITIIETAAWRGHQKMPFLRAAIFKQE